MKTLVLLLALAAATPALPQTPDAPTIANIPEVEKIAPAAWEFSPDFLRDQNRVSWRLEPKFEDDLIA